MNQRLNKIKIYVFIIAKECLDRRCGRSDTELIRDKPEEEIIKEISLIAEIRKILLQTLSNMEQQQMENINHRQKLEYDWSDKRIAFEIENKNCTYNNNSTTTLFKAGAIRFPNE